MSANTSNLPISQEMQNNLSMKIKDMLMGMIPDEKINELIQREVDAFFESETLEFVYHEGQEHWNATAYDKKQKLIARVSPFRAMVWNECRRWTQEKMEDFFRNPESDWYVNMNQFWDGNSSAPKVEAVMSERLTQLLQENAMSMAANMFRTMFAQAATDASMHVRHELMNGQIPLPPR